MGKVWFAKDGASHRTPGRSVEFPLDELVTKIGLLQSDYFSKEPPTFSSPNQELDAVRSANHIVVQIAIGEHIDDGSEWRAGFYVPNITVTQAIQRLGL